MLSTAGRVIAAEDEDMRRWADVDMAGKLAASFLALSLVWGGLCGASLFFLAETRAAYSGLLDEEAAAVASAKEIQYHVATQNAAIASYLVATMAGSLGDSQSQQRIREAGDAIDRLTAETLAGMKDEQDRELLGQIGAANSAFKDAAAEAIAAVETSAVKAQVIMQTKIAPLSNQLIGHANRLSESQQAKLEARREASGERIRKLVMINLAAGIGILLGALAAGVWFARRMAKPILRMLEHTERIASGDLRLEPIGRTSRDEVGRLTGHFHAMAGQLRELIGRIADSAGELSRLAEPWRRSAEETALASRQIAAAMEDVQEEGARQLREADRADVSAVETLASVRTIASLSAGAKQEAEAMLGKANRGAKEMSGLSARMQTLAASVGELQAAARGIGERTEGISGISATIRAVANQTRILAFNASIEASRLGSEGRGFAVIAEEIRSLSRETTKLAEDIRLSVAKIREETTLALSKTERAMQDAGEGSAAIGLARDTFDELRQSFAEVAAGVTDISAAAAAVEIRTELMKATTGTMKAASEATAARTSEASAAAEQQYASMEELADSLRQLNELADRLQQSSGRFAW
ncbi:methyl-accepting chemotaxis protein [Cohnella fermenti]|uniref:Methyl-accepting chemotaxis protein n=1 Tax=Cohnella fermenti TaxID=2565925 RepID=A0A4S4BST5_9BACL|nr:methyl-accepting chemotaxis protein [Cohnella fermenti]THF78078.1 methyl-accepting chemotaxis protein [Cohnella fermenti]